MQPGPRTLERKSFFNHAGPAVPTRPAGGAAPYATGPCPAMTPAMLHVPPWWVAAAVVAVAEVPPVQHADGLATAPCWKSLRRDGRDVARQGGRGVAHQSENHSAVAPALSARRWGPCQEASRVGPFAGNAGRHARCRPGCRLGAGMPAMPGPRSPSWPRANHGRQQSS